MVAQAIRGFRGSVRRLENRLIHPFQQALFLLVGRQRDRHHFTLIINGLYIVQGAVYPDLVATGSGSGKPACIHPYQDIFLLPAMAVVDRFYFLNAICRQYPDGCRLNGQEQEQDIGDGAGHVELHKGMYLPTNHRLPGDKEFRKARLPAMNVTFVTKNRTGKKKFCGIQTIFATIAI